MSRSSTDRAPEEVLSTPEEICPLCEGSGSRRAVLRLQDEPRVELLACDRCGGCSADRMPTGEFLASLYDPSRYSSSLVSASALTTRCARALLCEARFAPDRDLAILDYGGSDGALSRELRRQLLAAGHAGRVESTVVDLYPRDDTPHQRFVTPEHFAKSETRFDLLVASAVLEHIPRPGPVIAALLAHAAPDAVLYARTPWDAPLHRCVPGYRIKWPRHLHDLGPGFWDRFLEVFSVNGSTIFSRPSIVETCFAQAPLRTLLAHLLKAPAHLENAWLRPGLGYRGRAWRFVGGWEVAIRLSPSAAASASPGATD